MSDTSASQSTPPAGGEHDPKGTMLEPEAHVLATLRSDGTRRWIRPRLSQGQLLKARRVVAYGLMVFFVALPHLTIKGKPAVLLDILHREFTLFGTTFVPTDTLSAKGDIGDVQGDPISHLPREGMVLHDLRIQTGGFSFFSATTTHGCFLLSLDMKARHIIGRMHRAFGGQIEGEESQESSSDQWATF